MDEASKTGEDDGHAVYAVTDDWVVSAVWEPLASGELPKGPSSMTISLHPNASPKSRQRGVNSGVMRRVEGLLVEITADMEKRARAVAEREGHEVNEKFLAAVARQVAALPEGGPRSKTGDYYGDLLHIYEVLEAVQPDPAGDLANLMGMPVNTVKSQIYRAKKAKEEGGK